MGVFWAPTLAAGPLAAQGLLTLFARRPKSVSLYLVDVLTVKEEVEGEEALAALMQRLGFEGGDEASKKAQSGKKPLAAAAEGGDAGSGDGDGDRLAIVRRLLACKVCL